MTAAGAPDPEDLGGLLRRARAMRDDPFMRRMVARFDAARDWRRREGARLAAAGCARQAGAPQRGEGHPRDRYRVHGAVASGQ